MLLPSAADGLEFRGLGFNDFIENPSLWESGRPLEALEPSKKVGGFSFDQAKSCWYW